ncbi:MAG TPA: DUF4912 domain-containing protein, partial [Candidatus Dormibacteraeota bacterium]|nr:DUF4912 domain-containing protein [Candidatus Dormibacteraeota bacterium]
PYCLYAYWDFTDEQLNFYNARSVHQHLVIRVQEEATRRQPIPEVHLHADSRHWFLHVPSAGVSYVAEIGYYEAGKGWVGIAHSSPVSTPVASMSEERQVQFAVFSPEPAAEPRSFQTYREQPHAAPRWSMEQREFRQEQFEPAQSRAEAPRHWEAHAPGPDPGTGLQPRIKWTSLQENALEEIIHLSLSRHEWLGSMEIAEWSEQRELRERQLVPTPPVVDLELPGPSSLELGISSPTGEEQISSPIRSEQKPERGFWFNVNAELIIYGATDPTARVTIGGRPIRLRPDGTFSYRFALPDGQCELPAVAVSTDDDTRSAALKFSRSTDYTGEVGAHPQDASLRKPSPENVE